MNMGSEGRPQVARVREAVDWFTRFRDDDLSEAELVSWFEWCADPENFREYQKVGEIWRGLGDLAPPPAEAVPESAADSLYPTTSRRWRRGAAWAAMLAFLAVVLASVSYWQKFAGEARYAAQSTIESKELPDGSQLTLAPRSAVSTDFSGATRAISMPRGEAFFRVHPDKTKPFVVRAAGVSVTAVGTAFDVNADTRRVVVTVQEGTVEVSGSNNESWRVGRGSRITYDRSTKAAAVERVQADELVAWHTGRLEYVDRPLVEVVADISRYSSHVVEMPDPHLASIRYTGAVLTASIDDWLAAIEAIFPIRVTTTPEGHYVLVSRAPSPQVP